MPGLVFWINAEGKITAAAINAETDTEERLCEELLNRMVQPEMLAAEKPLECEICGSR